jgi:hypothetical protein
VPFVFHVLSATGPNADKMHIYSETEVVLSAAMVRYWLNFASSGDPSMNHDIPPPQIKGGCPTNMHFSTDMRLCPTDMRLFPTDMRLPLFNNSSIQ